MIGLKFWRARIFVDKRATASIEFAIVALPFLALIFAALQLSMIYFCTQALETFTESNSRQILVGLIQQQNLSAAQYKAQLCAKLPSLFKCGNFFVDVVSTSAFANANTALPTLTFDSNGNVTNNWSFSPGNPGDIVIVRMLYQWSVFNLPFGLNLINQVNGSRLLMATSVFKNEP